MDKRSCTHKMIGNNPRSRRKYGSKAIVCVSARLEALSLSFKICAKVRELGTK